MARGLCSKKKKKENILGGKGGKSGRVEHSNGEMGDGAMRDLLLKRQKTRASTKKYNKEGSFQTSRI